MENKELIEFKKRRDLGSIINDAFAFIRLVWKDYFGTIIKIAGPVLIVLLVTIGLYINSVSGMVKSFDIDNQDFNSGFDFTMVIYLIIAIIAGLVFYILMQMASLYFIKSYIDNNGLVNKDEIKLNIKQNFWKFLGYGILMMLMIVIGMFLCLLPGIYLAIVLSLGTSILVFENKGVSDTISHCFNLIKGRWWETFGVVLVVGFLVGILGQIFGVPALVYQFTKMGIVAQSQDPTEVFNLFSDPIYLFLMVISYVGQFLLSSITLITSVFIYFDLNEQKNATGSLEKIESLGNNNYRKN